ncbi:hypothetical protein [Tunturiibacter gelidoferens]|uniref:Uncharacterized protein n=1 Tax=Tunturiibacter gelidiferens TaxID=3069689 RepID=A0ACC5P468_9BACT|nr:hypothetical protein [Edaphobacter lichenicola]MBB5341469.1 hypothetical protein [Edaphobacter lichenicola]
MRSIRAFDPLLPFLLDTFGLELPLVFFLLKLSLPFNTPFILVRWRQA